MADSESVPAEIARHLKAAEEGLGSGAGETRAKLELAQLWMEEMLGALPMHGAYPRRSALEHLRSAHALAEEHLRMAGTEGQVRLLVEAALSEARMEGSDHT